MKRENFVEQERAFHMNKKILIVDDEKDTLSVLEKALTTEDTLLLRQTMAKMPKS